MKPWGLRPRKMQDGGGRGFNDLRDSQRGLSVTNLLVQLAMNCDSGYIFYFMIELEVFKKSWKKYPSKRFVFMCNSQ